MSTRPACPGSHRLGFTLVELLACIAIIGILAGIVLAVISPIRAKARTTRCLSNMRQAGVAFALYAGEHNNTLPVQKTDRLTLTNPEGWVGQISPYLENYNTLLCSESQPLQPYPNVSYGYNSFASRFSAPTQGPVYIAESSTPARNLLLLDTSLSGTTNLSFIITNVNVNSAQAAPHPYGSDTNGARTVLFVDGHVELAPTGTLSWRQLQWPQ